MSEGHLPEPDLELIALSEIMGPEHAEVLRGTLDQAVAQALAVARQLERAGVDDPLATRAEMSKALAFQIFAAYTVGEFEGSKTAQLGPEMPPEEGGHDQLEFDRLRFEDEIKSIVDRLNPESQAVAYDVAQAITRLAIERADTLQALKVEQEELLNG